MHVKELFETHLNVSDLNRAMKFYGEVLGLELAYLLEERRVAFYWLGGRGKSMLGLWEDGSSPQRLSLHVAFNVDVDELRGAVQHLRGSGVVPLDFWRNPTDEPVVIGWMPAASLYFNDPDGNLLEFIAMLPEAPEPERGVIPWSEWDSRSKSR